MDKRLGAIGLGIFLALAVLWSPVFPSMAHPARATLAVTVLMGIWWMTEALPLAVTALVPLVCFPLLQVFAVQDVARNYGDPMVYLFLGGFLLATAMERWDLHKRIAFRILLFMKGDLSLTLLGFLISTAFISMWVSNTATALMMLPIALSVIHVAEEKLPAKEGRSFATMLLLGVAYGASIGGMGSLIGSPPNLVLAGFLPRAFPGEHSITFLQWLLFGVPVVLLFIPLAWIVLIAFGGEMSFLGKRVKLDVTQAINKEYRALGAVSRQEMAVAMIFSITALLWIFREPIAIGGLTVPGWSRLFPVPGYLQDAVVSIAAGIVLFVIRIEGKPLLLWTEAEKRIPWGVLLLFGGGFALADAFAKSGLAGWTGEHLRGISALPPFFTILCMALITTFLTEIASNTAIAATVLPIFATLVPSGVHPVAFLIPATLGASCAFMLPAATPPNAIVFASGHLTVARMAKTGLIMNLATALLITVLSLTLIPAIFH